MKPTIYVITYHKFNHDLSRNGAKPLDSRFINTDKNYVFYLIDKERPDVLSDKQVLFEHEIDPLLPDAGRFYFAEWTFLLAEAKHAFCTYPLFMTSSRFYEKNLTLTTDLNKEWDFLFSQFNKYRYGWLSSYDRPLRWIPLHVNKYIERFEYGYFFPFTQKAYDVTCDILKLRNNYEFTNTPDLFCNYIGFKDREALLDYVRFYRPLIDYFFDENLKPKVNLDEYVKFSGNFRNEKPFTYLLELFSHAYFYKSHSKIFTMHYNGYFEVDIIHKKIKPIKIFKKTINQRIKFYKSTFKQIFVNETLKWTKADLCFFIKKYRKKIPLLK